MIRVLLPADLHQINQTSNKAMVLVDILEPWLISRMFRHLVRGCNISFTEKHGSGSQLVRMLDAAEFGS